MLRKRTGVTVQTGIHALTLAAEVVRLVRDLAPLVADGDLSPGEARRAARDWSNDHPDALAVRVRGVDIVTPRAQSNLAAGVGECLAMLARATR